MATKRRQRGAIVPPGRAHDPEGTEPAIRSASKEWARRLRKVRDAYVALLERVPRAEVVANRRSYTYELWPDMLASLDAVVDELLLGDPYDAPWLFADYVQPSYERGTARAIRNLAAQSLAYRAERATLRDVLLLPQYQRRVLMVRARVFEAMQGLSAQVKADMGRLLADGLARGQNPLAIADSLSEQLGIEEYRAERIARTEINTALRRARWDETEDAQAAYGLSTLEMHISALSPTTRAEHAARHGRLYTVDAVRDWFAAGANSINCKCSTVSVMVDANNQPLVSAVVERTTKARERFEKGNDA